MVGDRIMGTGILAACRALVHPAFPHDYLPGASGQALPSATTRQDDRRKDTVSTQRRLVILALATLSIALGVAASPVTQFRESWVDNIWKWHQGPLFGILAVAAIIAVYGPLTQKLARIWVRAAGTLFILAGLIKSPIALALFIYPGAVFTEAGLALISVIAMWATAIVVFVGVASRPAESVTERQVPQ